MKPLLSQLLGVVAVATLATAARAGDVSVVVKHGDLVLQGHDGAIDASIDQSGLAAGEFRITPNSGTTVNGAGSAQIVTGVTRDMRVSLPNKTSYLGANAVDVPRDLRVKIGKHNSASFSFTGFIVGRDVRVVNDGALELLLWESDVAGRVTWKGGAGFDDPDFRGLHVAGPMKISLGAGMSVFRFLDLSQADQSLEVDAGSGEDQFLLGTSTIAKDLEIDAGGGTNEFMVDGIVAMRDVRFSGGGGPDTATLTSIDAGRDLRVTLGGGNNSAILTDCSLDRTLSYSGGNGVDMAHFENVLGADDTRIALGSGGNILSSTMNFTMRRLTVTAGGGLDTLALQNVTCETDFSALLGGGDNQMTLTTAFVGGDLLVKAGAGNDTVTATSLTVMGASKYRLGGGMNAHP